MPSKLRQRIHESDCLVFFDFEAASPSHTIIAIGMNILPKKENSFDFQYDSEVLYGRLIQNQNPISDIVQSLTGITSERLEKEGIPFIDSVKEIKDLLRPYHKKSYFSYGKSDIQFLKNTIDISEESLQFFKSITNRYIDLMNYLSHFIVSDKGQPLSLHGFADLYNIKPEHPYHDPRTDSEVLKEVLLDFYLKEDITVNEILKHYNRLKNPDLDKKLATLLLEGKDKKDAIKEIKRAL